MLARCSGGLRCVIPCDGIVGNSLTHRADPCCLLEASNQYSDESPFVCDAGGLACGPDMLACTSACFVPCDGEVGCLQNGKFGDEQPDLCGALDVGLAAATTQPPFSEPAFGQTPASRFVPGDRDGAVGVFSASESLVMLVGGNRDAEPTREIWLYDTRRRSFSREFREGPLRPLNVLAATYDSVSRALLVLDELEFLPIVKDMNEKGSGKPAAPGKPATPAPPNKPSHTPAVRKVRLVAHDLATKQSTLVGTWKRTPNTDRVALVSLDDGTLLLLRSGSTLAVTFATRLRRDASGVKWLGQRVVPGRMVLSPQNTELGVAIALARNGRVELERLEPASLHPGPAPKEL